MRGVFRPRRDPSHSSGGVVNITGTDSQIAGVPADWCPGWITVGPVSRIADRIAASLRTNSNAPREKPRVCRTRRDRSRYHGARPAARGGVPERLFRLVFGVYSLSLLIVLMTVAALFALLLPSLRWRRSSTRWIARLWLAVAFLRLRVEGLEGLPPDSCVLVANHSSYLDGILMTACLPPRFSFVIKREASDMPVVGFLLRRIGSEFVDRHSAGGRQRDARRVLKRAGARSLAGLFSRRHVRLGRGPQAVSHRRVRRCGSWRRAARAGRHSRCAEIDAEWRDRADAGDDPHRDPAADRGCRA